MRDGIALEEPRLLTLHDPAFAAAVQATGRRDLIIASFTNDVCTVYPVLAALRQGYRVPVVAEARASITRTPTTSPCVEFPGGLLSQCRRGGHTVTSGLACKLATSPSSVTHFLPPSRCFRWSPLGRTRWSASWFRGQARAGSPLSHRAVMTTPMLGQRSGELAELSCLPGSVRKR